MINMKRRVAMLLFSHYPFDDRVYREAKSLIDSKAFKVTIFAWKRPQDTNSQVYNKIKVIRINTKSQTSIKVLKHLFLFNILLLFRLMRLPSFSIYHAHDFTTLPTAFLVAKIKRAKVVYDAHEYYPALLVSDKIVGQPFIALVITVEKYLSNWVDLLLTVTNAQTRLYIQKYKIKEATVIFNAPAISQERIEKLISNEEIIRRKWGVGKFDYVIAYPGAINPGRCLVELIESIPTLNKIQPIKVILIGPSSIRAGYRKKLTRLISSRGIQKNVLIFDEISQDEVAEIFCICDLVYAIYPKKRDYPIAIPNKILYAARFRKRFVTSNFGEMKSLTTKLSMGFIVDPHNREAITTTLKKVMMTEEKSIIVDIRTIEELWWEKQEIKLLESYNSLIME
jgi:glycosyltransferase involved in cell wall biosynthesis